MTGPQENSHSNTVHPWHDIPGPILIIGGAYSGKSEFAHQTLRPDIGATVLGTCAEDLPEMASRIEWLQSLRPEPWKTVSHRIADPQHLETIRAGKPQFLIDALNHWLADVIIGMLDRYSIDQLNQVTLDRVDELLQWFETPKDYRCVVVSGDVSYSLPPETEAPRVLRRVLGLMNQQLAAQARSVVEVRAGIPIRLK